MSLKFTGKLCAMTSFHQSTWKSQNCDFDSILLLKVENVWAAGELCPMTTKNDAKFEEELTCQFKTDMSNFMNFDMSTQKPQKNWTLMDCL